MFASWRDYWKFENEVRRQRRYSLTNEARRFLEGIAATCPSRVEQVPEGWRGWRAQLGHDWRYDDGAEGEVACAFNPDRMKPLADRAHEGRVNPKGIPCLYMATTPETAMSEVRPWVGSSVSLGEFIVARPLQIVNCCKYHEKMPIFLKEPDRGEIEKAVWAYIDRAFARPVTSSDDRADYAPTQIIAELFKDLGYDGLYYKSAFGEKGYNVAIFDLGAAGLVTCSLHEVTKIGYSFRQSDSTYSVSNKSKRSRRKISSQTTASSG